MTVTRTCVGCRGRDTTERLVRVVRDQRGIRADQGRTAAGRGAYVHPVRDCLDAAVTRKAFARALRVAADTPVIGVLDLDEVMTVTSGAAMTNTQGSQR